MLIYADVGACIRVLLWWPDCLFCHWKNITTRRKASWIGHNLRKNYRLDHVIEGKVEEMTEMTGRRGGRRKHLLDGLKRRLYWKLNKEAINRTRSRTLFGRSYGPVVRHTEVWMINKEGKYLLLLPGAELPSWRFWPSQRPLSISLDPGRRLSSFWSSFGKCPVWCYPPICTWVFLVIFWLGVSS